METERKQCIQYCVIESHFEEAKRVQNLSKFVVLNISGRKFSFDNLLVAFLSAIDMLNIAFGRDISVECRLEQCLIDVNV